MLSHRRCARRKNLVSEIRCNENDKKLFTCCCVYGCIYIGGELFFSIFLVPASPELSARKQWTQRDSQQLQSREVLHHGPCRAFPIRAAKKTKFFDSRDSPFVHAGGALSPTLVHWSSMELILHHRANRLTNWTLTRKCKTNELK